MKEIVYAKWDSTTLWYLGEVTSMDVLKKTYSVHFMDGYSSENVAQSKIRRVPTKEKKNSLINKVSTIPGITSRVCVRQQVSSMKVSSRFYVINQVRIQRTGVRDSQINLRGKGIFKSIFVRR